MSVIEQQEVKKTYYNEAVRYIANAHEMLQKAGKIDDVYLDDKYVKAACGIAYSGVLKALDGYLRLKDVPRPKKRGSIEYYRTKISKLDLKLVSDLTNAYNILYLDGYYEGVTDVDAIQTGFKLANRIIKRIQPDLN